MTAQLSSIQVIVLCRQLVQRHSHLSHQLDLFTPLGGHIQKEKLYKALTDLIVLRGNIIFVFLWILILTSFTLSTWSLHSCPYWRRNVKLDSNLFQMYKCRYAGAQSHLLHLHHTATPYVKRDIQD